jgi:uncharacterized protein with PIN domain
VRFLINGMLPPGLADHLREAGYEAVTPRDLGAANLPDDVLVEIASSESWVIVTENASDFANVTTCAVILVRKSWWPPEGLSVGLAKALIRWREEHPEPGPWAHWMEPGVR